MVKVKDRLLGLESFCPRNTLKREIQSSVPFAPSTGPPSKRRKTLPNIPPAHTNLEFALQPDEAHAAGNLRKSSFTSSRTHATGDSHTSQSNNAKRSSSNVAELRNVDRYTRNPQAAKRQRRKGPGMPRNPPQELTKGEQGSDDEITSVPTPASHEGHSSEQHITFYQDRFQTNKTVARTMTPSVKIMEATIDRTDPKRKHRIKDSSEDELALDESDMPEKQVSKRPAGVSTIAQSLSRKGDMSRTKFQNSARSALPTSAPSNEAFMIERAKEIIQTGLRVVRGSSQPFKYLASDTDLDEICYLAPLEMSYILFPVDQAGNQLKQFSYLIVNLENTRAIVEAPSTCIVDIQRIKAEPAHSAGAKLMLEFPREDFERFNQWVVVCHPQKRGNFPFNMSNKSSLEKLFEDSLTRSHKRRAPRDDDLPEVGVDIMLMERNKQKTSHHLQDKSGSLDRHPPYAKVRDRMRQPVTDDPSAHQLISTKPRTTNGYAVRSSPKQLDFPRVAAVKRPVRTTRTAFAPSGPSYGLDDSSSDPEPEPDGWTLLNPGWDKDWRSSLVFPTQGKNRATVDKEDIHRLDEGQFLNDNIIIFYLRYLQHELESSRPDLAQRVYFHNTFFYEKLKSTSNHPGINYDSVRSWTSKVDLFTKDYIVVPINEFSHWYVAIIYNAPRLVPPPDNQAGKAVDHTDHITIQEDREGSVVDADQYIVPSSPHGIATEMPLNSAAVALEAQGDVVDTLSRMSLNGPVNPVSEANQTPDQETGTVEDDSKPGKAKATIVPIKGSVEYDGTKSNDLVNGTDVPEAKDSTNPVHETNRSERREIIDLVNAPKEAKSEIINLVKDSDEVKDTNRIALLNSSQARRKPGRRQSAVVRKVNLDQPKIITLDSLGGSHSPTCTILRHYLVAELKDKKGIEIPSPGALGLTAKDVPQQTNHCDCGLFLLGYTQEFLKDPDKFVHSILQRDDDLVWKLNPSQLRADIRDLIFKLQGLQQKSEDEQREQKRQSAASKKRVGSGSKGEPDWPDAALLKPYDHGPAMVPKIEQKHIPSLGNLDEVESTTPKPLKSPVSSEVPVVAIRNNVDFNNTQGEKGKHTERNIESLASKISAGGPTNVGLTAQETIVPLSQRDQRRSVTTLESCETQRGPTQKPSTTSTTRHASEPRDISHVPGAFPSSPTRDPRVVQSRPASRDAEGSEEIEKDFLKLLKSGSSTPSNHMVVKSPKQEPPEPRDRPRGQQVIEVLLPSVEHRSRHDHRAGSSTTTGDRKKEVRVESGYFAGKNPNDKIGSATARDELASVGRRIIDLSD